MPWSIGSAIIFYYLLGVVPVTFPDFVDKTPTKNNQFRPQIAGRATLSPAEGDQERDGGTDEQDGYQDDQGSNQVFRQDLKQSLGSLSGTNVC